MFSLTRRRCRVPYSPPRVQLISGVSIIAYWLSTFIFDIINYMVPCVLSIILIALFDIEQLLTSGRIWATLLLFVFYGTSVAVCGRLALPGVCFFFALSLALSPTLSFSFFLSLFLSLSLSLPSLTHSLFSYFLTVSLPLVRFLTHTHTVCIRGYDVVSRPHFPSVVDRALRTC